LAFLFVTHALGLLWFYRRQETLNNKRDDSMSERLKTLFDKTINSVFAVILGFIIIGIIIGTAQLFVTTLKLLAFEGVTGHYIDIISDVLTLYVLIELSKSLIDYFDTHRIRLTFIVDAAIVFVLREVLIMLFKHEVEPDMLYALSAFLCVLGALRISSILVNQRDKQMFGEK
jgi:uncharacterized membrane protein (DUF373 family)